MDLLDPKDLAVLVIDVQVGLFCASPPPFEAGPVIERINSVSAKARAAAVPIILVQHDGPPEGDWLVPQSPGWQLHPDLQREPGDLILRKTTGDGFYETDLEKTLRRRGIRRLLLMGYATDFCIDATLRNAVSKDFEVLVVSDAHTTDDAPTLKAAEIRAHFNWAWAESSSRRGVHLLNAQQVRFGES